MEKTTKTKPKEIDLNGCDCRLDTGTREIACTVTDPELFADITRSSPRKINFDLVIPEDETKGGEDNG